MHAAATSAPPDGLQAAFDAARAACLRGHEAGCTYGGLVASHGYWLVAEHCPRRHSNECAWCARPAVTSFVGWEQLSVWGVPACRPCADAYLAAFPDREHHEPPDRVEDPALAHLMADFENQIRDELTRKLIGPSEPGPAASAPSRPGITGLLQITDEISQWIPASSVVVLSPRAGLPPHPSCLDPRLPAGPTVGTVPARRAASDAGETTARARNRYEDAALQLVGAPGISAQQAGWLADAVRAIAGGGLPQECRPNGQPYTWNWVLDTKATGPVAVVAGRRGGKTTALRHARESPRRQRSTPW